MKKKFYIIIFLALLPLLIVFALSFYFYYQSAVKAENSSDKYYTLVIKNGDSLPLITKLLRKDKIISNETVFRLYLKLNNIDSNIQAGEYDIPPHISMQELSEILQTGSPIGKAG